MSRGTLFGGMILREATVLAEHHFPQNNARTKGAFTKFRPSSPTGSTTIDVLEGFDEEIPEIMSLVQKQIQHEPIGRLVMGDKLMIYYMSDNTIIAILIADKIFTPRIALTCLRDYYSQFTSSFTRAQILQAPTHGLQSFASQIRERMTYYSTDQAAAGLSNATEQLDQVKDVMRGNIDKLLERGERLDDLLARTDALTSTTVVFHKRAKQVHAAERWAENRRYIYASIIGGFIVFCLVWAGCGIPSFDRCRI